MEFRPQPSASDACGDSVQAPADTLSASKVPLKSNEFQRIYSVLFESAPEPILVTDEYGSIVQINAEVERCFGYKREELLGEKVEKLLPEDLRGIHEQHRDAYRAAPSFRPMSRGVEIFALRKDGSRFPADIVLTPVVTEQGLLVYCIIRDISERKEALEVARLLKFEETLTNLSGRFVNLPASRVDQEITAGLEELVDALETDRATVARFEPTTGDFVVTHAFARQGIPNFSERLARGVLPWLVTRVMAGEITKVESPADLPPEAHHEREYMESVGIKSSLIMPLRVGGKLIGGISTDSFRNCRRWDHRIVSRMRNVVDILANALARKHADEELQTAMARIRELNEKAKQENLYLRKEMKLRHLHSGIVGDSVGMTETLRKAEQVAITDTAVLILGETGTGKELLAHSIHEMSTRKLGPLVTINCAALPSTLIESELFGRERGAYTGALAREIGRFELADKSTIFLDEIGDLPLELQSKLLRVLQDGAFERLGSSKTIHVDVRVIAATNKDLQAMVKEGEFRADLFYRLNVFPIVIPPLRERPEDIPALVWHILKDLGRRIGRNVEAVPASTMRDLQNYSWPGNIRELRNFIERNLIVNPGNVFRVEMSELMEASRPAGQPLVEVEAEHLRKVLEGTRWRVRGKNGAAEITGLKPTTLEARMKKLGIRRPE